MDFVDMYYTFVLEEDDTLFLLFMSTCKGLFFTRLQLLEFKKSRIRLLLELVGEFVKQDVDSNNNGEGRVGGEACEYVYYKNNEKVNNVLNNSCTEIKQVQT